MVDWGELTLFLYITARMSGFVLFNPVLGRRNIPGIFRGGLILVLSVFVFSVTEQKVDAPGETIVFAIQILLELALGFVLGMVMNFFFYIVQLAGLTVDTQMGMTMNQIYDAGAQGNLSVTGEILNVLMTLLFFAANGHHTLLRMMAASGQIGGLWQCCHQPGCCRSGPGAIRRMHRVGCKTLYADFGSGAAGPGGDGNLDEGDSTNQCIFHQYRTEGANRACSVAVADFTLQ